VKIIIVGGGIIGCACALELAKAGCAVTVFERATPGAEASGAAAGILAPLGDSADTAMAKLALESWRRYPHVVQELPASYAGFVYVIDGDVVVADAPLVAGQVGRIRRDVVAEIDPHERTS